MPFRQTTEREFIYLFKDLGKYCSYGDAKNIIEAISKALKQVMAEKSDALGELLPISIKAIWDQAAFSESSSQSIVDLIQSYGALPARRDVEIALLAFFGTIREKQSETVAQWDKLIPDELKLYWDKSRDIADGLDVRQCL